MQAPINIIAPVKGPKGTTSNSFHIDYKFEKKIPVEVTTHGVEVIVRFLSFAGAFKIVYRSDGTMLSYHPLYMSFRFPAQHLINSYRMDGELVFICDEVTPRNNKVTIYLKNRHMGLRMVLNLLFRFNLILKLQSIKN